MKNHLNNILCGLALGVVAIASMPAKAQDQADQGQKDVASKPPSTGTDVTFIHKAAEGGLLEVQLGQLASQKAQDPDVKAFAEKMVTDHTMLNNKMQPVAMAYSVTPPSTLDHKDQAEYDKLSSLSGAAFDKAYVQAMVKDHHMDLREFRMEARSTTDPKLKTTVQEGTRVIDEHTRMIDQIAGKMGIPVPARPNPDKGLGAPANSPSAQ